MLTAIAWRNIWRNKRRTLITSGSVFFAVILAVIMRSVTDGIYDDMIDNVVSFSSGYIQIHNEGYWNERSIDNAFVPSRILTDLLNNTDGVNGFARRIESFALTSNNQRTKGTAIIGIEPLKEDRMNHLSAKIIQGKYFKDEKDNGILIGQGLAEYFHLKPGDSLILLSQGYHANSAAGIYPVRGILSLGSPELNSGLIYMSLQNSQTFLSADSLCTSISLSVENVNGIDKLAEKIRTGMNKEGKIEVMTWKQMMPEMDQFITADRSGHFIVIGILYLVISFGLYSTVLMMTYERRHEFGILISIGMKKSRLLYMMIAETIFVSFAGALLGMFAGAIIILYFHSHPIEFTGDIKEVYLKFGLEPVIAMSVKSSIFISQAVIIFVLSMIAAIYPGLKILKLKPVDAMRS